LAPIASLALACGHSPAAPDPFPDPTGPKPPPVAAPADPTPEDTPTPPPTQPVNTLEGILSKGRYPN
jgi:hypothetical protein